MIYKKSNVMVEVLLYKICLIRLKKEQCSSFISQTPGHVLKYTPHVTANVAHHCPLYLFGISLASHSDSNQGGGYLMGKLGDFYTGRYCSSRSKVLFCKVDVNYLKPIYLRKGIFSYITAFTAY